MREVSIKQGESLNVALYFKDDGDAMDISHVALAAQVRDAKDVLVANLPIIMGSEIGLAYIQIVDTCRWPDGRLRCDVRAAWPGQIQFTETFAIHVRRAVTQ
jgi:hypothetical protein